VVVVKLQVIYFFYYKLLGKFDYLNLIHPDTYFLISCLLGTTQDLTKRMIGRDMVQLEEQPRDNKSNIVDRPFSHSALSAFQPW